MYMQERLSPPPAQRVLWRSSPLGACVWLPPLPPLLLEMRSINRVSLRNRGCREGPTAYNQPLSFSPLVPLLAHVTNKPDRTCHGLSPLSEQNSPVGNILSSCPPPLPYFPLAARHIFWHQKDGADGWQDCTVLMVRGVKLLP